MSRSSVFAGGLVLLSMALSGCVERTITITSEPAGALVYLNDREIGRTPVDVSFVHYGTYDVRLVKDGYEPLLTAGAAKAPLWDAPGLDLFAELAPVQLRSDIQWHFVMDTVRNDRESLVERAREVRQSLFDADSAAGDVPVTPVSDASP